MFRDTIFKTNNFSKKSDKLGFAEFIKKTLIL